MNSSLRLPLICSLIALFASVASHAQLITVSPMRVTITGTERSAEIRVKNTGGDPVQVTTFARFKPLRSDAEGNIYLDSNATAEEMARACDSWLKVFPPKFSLPPHGTRTVRVIVSPPEGLDEGEYWSRLVFTAEKASGARALTVVDSSKEIKANVNIITSLTIPVTYRKGTVTTGLEMGEVIAKRDTVGKKGALGTVIPNDAVVVMVDTKRTGNSAYRGTIYASIRKDDGTEVATAERRVSVLWDQRMRLEFPRIPDGSYTLKLEARTEAEGSVADVIIEAPPVSKTVRLQITGMQMRVLADATR